MKTRTARELRRGINYGSNFASGMIAAGGNKMLRELLMQNLITWSHRVSNTANKAAAHTIGKTRQRFQASRSRNGV